MNFHLKIELKGEYCIDWVVVTPSREFFHELSHELATMLKEKSFILFTIFSASTLEFRYDFRKNLSHCKKNNYLY